MKTTDAITTIRLSGRDGLLAAVPSLLGFHPQESVVLLCVSGKRSRIGPVIRIDLEDVRSDGSGAAEQLLTYARMHAERVALVCYTALEQPAGGLTELLQSFLDSEFGLLDAVWVRAGLAGTWAVTGEVDEHEPRTPVPDESDPQVRTIVSAYALQGRALLPDRQRLRESIAGPSGPAATKANAALHQAADRILNRLGQRAGDEAQEMAAMARRSIADALAQVERCGQVATATAALLPLLLVDVAIRDALVARTIVEVDLPWIPLLISVAAGVPDEEAAEVCAVLAVAAYRTGDGALAQVAVDRALLGDPEHRLAHLMLDVMQVGLPPEELLGLAAAITEAESGAATFSPGTAG